MTWFDSTSMGVALPYEVLGMAFQVIRYFAGEAQDGSAVAWYVIGCGFDPHHQLHERKGFDGSVRPCSSSPPTSEMHGLKGNVGALMLRFLGHLVVGIRFPSLRPGSDWVRIEWTYSEQLGVLGQWLPIRLLTGVHRGHTRVRFLQALPFQIYHREGING